MNYSDLSTNSENDSQDYSQFSSNRSSFESSTSISSVEDNFKDNKKLWKTKDYNKLDKCLKKYNNYKTKCEIGEGLYKLRKILNNDTDSDEEILAKWILKMKTDINHNTNTLLKVNERQKELSLLLDASTECIQGRIEIKYNCEMIHLKSINKLEKKKFIDGHDKAIKRMYFYLKEGIHLLTIIQDKLNNIQKNINKRIEEEDKQRKHERDMLGSIIYSSSQYLKKYNNYS